MPSDLYEPLPRCCPGHRDWIDLRSCLIRAYVPRVAPRLIDEHLARARIAVSDVIPLKTPEDQLEVASLIVGHQLEIHLGRRVDVARLDPQQHNRARRE